MKKDLGKVTSAYCFNAGNSLVVPWSLSVTAMVMLLPSAATVILAMLISLPSRLSVSSKEFFPMRLTETLVIRDRPCRVRRCRRVSRYRTPR